MNKKIPLIMIVLFLLGSIALGPLIVHHYSLSFLEAMPEKAVNSSMTQAQIQAQWNKKEPVLTTENFDNVTVYWNLGWFLYALLGGNSSKLNQELSVMAYQVARYHIRVIGTQNPGDLWQPLSRVNLAIWLQQNWTAEEIVIKYNEVFLVTRPGA